MTGAPGHIVIGPLTWSLRFDSTATLRDNRAEDFDAFGRTDPTALEITLEEGRPTDAQRVTVLHELVHAALWTFGADLKHAQEEQACTHLAPALLGVLRDNPDLVEWLRAAADALPAPAGE